MKCRAVRRSAWAALAVVALVMLLSALPALAQDAAKEPAYRVFPLIGSRLAVWAVAQLHLNFAAFILGVPIFAVIIEIIGWRTGRRAVRLALARVRQAHLRGLLDHGAAGRAPPVPVRRLLPEVLDVHDVDLLPDLLDLRRCCSSPRPSPSTSGTTAGTGSAARASGSTSASASSSNLFGTAILFVANSWVTFMISPAGIDESGALKGSRVGGDQQLHVDAHQHPPADRQHRVRRHDRRRPTRRSASSAPRPTRSAPATTGWATSATSWRSRPSSSCRSPATSSAARSTRSTRPWASR